MVEKFALNKTTAKRVLAEKQDELERGRIQVEFLRTLGTGSKHNRDMDAVMREVLFLTKYIKFLTEIADG